METRHYIQLLITALMAVLIALGGYELGRHSASTIVNTATGSNPQVNINPR